MMKESWTERYNNGKQLREAYPELSYIAAIEAATNERPELVEWLFNDQAEWGEKTCFVREQFVKAGFYGDEPQQVLAIRYGSIPEAGFSVNHSTGEAEQGISVVRIIKDESDTEDTSIYAVTQGWQDIPLYVITGWYLGRHGADGEPLLVAAKIVKEV